MSKTNPGGELGECIKRDATEFSRVSSHIPTGCLGIGTVCCITLDGILMKRGIFVNTSFAGVVEIDGGRATSFSDLIASPLPRSHQDLHGEEDDQDRGMHIPGIRAYPRERQGDPL